MRDVDVSQIKDTLSTLKAQDLRREANPSEYFPALEEDFRRGVATKLKALDVLATSPRPELAEQIRLDTPFLIWSFRDGGPPSFLTESHLEPLNSWARFRSSRRSAMSAFGGHDEVGFYFLWQNETGSDAVLNVSSHIMLAGRASVFAKAGFIATPWGASTIGNSGLTLNARIKVYEWWNQPPTQPLEQPSQEHIIKSLYVTGGWRLLGSGNGESEWISGNEYVHYDVFHVPANAVAVFEVSLLMAYLGISGNGEADFQSSYQKIVCPYVRLETLTTPSMVAPT